MVIVFPYYKMFVVYEITTLEENRLMIYWAFELSKFSTDSFYFKRCLDNTLRSKRGEPGLLVLPWIDWVVESLIWSYSSDSPSSICFNRYLSKTSVLPYTRTWWYFWYSKWKKVGWRFWSILFKRLKKTFPDLFIYKIRTPEYQN